MVDDLLKIVAPHYCYGCSKIGTVLCDNCKYDISFERFSLCIVCRQDTFGDNLCNSCQEPYSRAWCVGERSGLLQNLIGTYKFKYTRAIGGSLAQLLSEVVDDVPPTTVIVPVPTVPAHIRERGFDHMQLVAERLGRQRGLVVNRLLERTSTTKQRGASRQERLQQASTSFRLRGVIEAETPYLLVDDVVTTGATLYYAARTLREGGAREVWVAALARQPLD